ncbi:MAG: pyridoxamine 5'-phosphate oxidase [Alphaproteobacteria bacterium]
MEEINNKNPIDIFHSWFEEAHASEINDPGAMALATSTKDGKPSVRMVLLKQSDENGFKFHTNCESQKGTELLENPSAALCFYWKSLRKQVRIEGTIEIASEEEADSYFKDRPYARQIGAHASQQSRPLTSRKALEDKIHDLQKEYPQGEDVPRPSYWVGYRLIPQKIEFWWDNPDRLHDRLLFTRKADNTWDTTRLYP